MLYCFRQKIAKRYPNVQVGTFSPPYKPVFTIEDTKQMIHAVNSFCPDVLFVGMTAPKQEKWTFENKHELNVKVICTIGAVFDFYAGIIERPSVIWVNNGLEWLGRLLKEPKRLAKRYLYYGPIFIYLMLRAKIQQRFISA